MNDVLERLTYKSIRFAKRNAPTILTCIGGAGVVATTFTAVKATPKAIELLNQAEEKKGESLTRLEVVQTAGHVYIPSLLLGLSTISCIFGANILNKRKQAALVSAYALLDTSYKEYKNKVIGLYGEESNRAIRTEIAKDHYESNDVEDDDDGKHLFYEEYSQRYFRATNETVLRARYELNKIVSESGAATLNDYFDLLQIPRMDYGEYIGWSSAQMFEMYWDSWINFHDEKVEMEDGLECWIVSVTEPFPRFDEY